MGKLVFDTLKYVKMLTGVGVEHGDIHAESLADALSQNVYVKSEVDKMIEDVLRQSDRRFNEQMRESDKRFAEQTRRIEKETAGMKAEIKSQKTEMKAEIKSQKTEMKAEINKVFNRHTMVIITILGSLMALFTFIEHLIH